MEQHPQSNDPHERSSVDGLPPEQRPADRLHQQSAAVDASYTRRTRPMIARLSFYAALMYALLSQIPTDGLSLLGWVLMPWQYDATVLMTLFAPALAYTGARGFEKWKAGGSI